jgi:hypothetical protein
MLNNDFPRLIPSHLVAPRLGRLYGSKFDSRFPPSVITSGPPKIIGIGIVLPLLPGSIRRQRRFTLRCGIGQPSGECAGAIIIILRPNNDFIVPLKQ